MSGQARAVRVLEDALIAASAQPSPDPAHIEHLQRELAKKRAAE